MNNQHCNEVERGSNILALKSGFWYVISTFLIKGIAFITTPLFARLMSKSEYGEFSNYASWQSVILIIIGMELYNVVGCLYYEYKDKFDDYLSSLTILSCVSVCCFYVTLLVSKEWFCILTSIPNQYIHILCFTLFFTSCKTLFLARERTLYNYRNVVVITTVDLIISIMISLVLVYFANDYSRLSARIYGFYIPSSLVGLYCSVKLLKNGLIFNTECCKKSCILAFPLVVHYLTIYLLTSTDVIVTKHVLGSDYAAIMSIAISVIHILTVLFQSLSSALSTWMMDNIEKNNFVKIRSGLRVYLCLLSSITILVILLAPEIILVLGGSNYISSLIVIPDLVLSVFVQAIVTLLTIVLTYYKRISKTVYYTIFIALASVILKFFLLNSYGIEALPKVNVLAYICLFTLYLVLIHYYKYNRFFDYRFLILSICVIGFFSHIGLWLYEKNNYRYAIIAGMFFAFVVCLYRKKKVLLEFFSHKRKLV